LDLSEAIYSQIKATTAITALTSNRIYPIVAPQGARKPFITYQEISEVPVHTMIADPKIRMFRMQISSWSTSYSNVVSVSTQIKTILRDKTGTLGSSNFKVQRIFFDGKYDVPDINPETDKITYHRAQDFIVWTTC